MPSESRGMVVHSGGPTAVLNASLAGIIEAWAQTPRTGSLFGARFGVQGLVAGDWIDLSGADAEAVRALRAAPGSAIGSSRIQLTEAAAEGLLSELRRKRVDCLFYTGGNGSMGTAWMLAQLAEREHPELRVIGVPKTVDNDLMVTDHSPGYGSAARFYALAVRDMGEDNRALRSPVTVVEAIGRNAGWVAGATALARQDPDDAPHLIYLPERPPTIERICQDVASRVERLGRAVVVACEGLRDPAGHPFGAALDRAGSAQHELARNLGHVVAEGISSITGLRARSEKPGLLGRSCSFAVSASDAEESYRCGRAAVEAAAAGCGAAMVALRRVSSDPYSCETFLAPLASVANAERLVPDAWIDPSGSDVTPDFVEYVRPLASPIEGRSKLGAI
ncbi:MAG: diphosphate--fructose-6-phosphate 1-phosphotransferase [Bryobacterales bacterium]|nr:diphosphate--fructose-6-phosphate 1-phosphotransferase [Bryobacterales bacterium]MDE0262927.1 diphosphate--fructose-6-phosphate 1-phosphotransferase [Bryobacterales bacterium]MDE0620581.1 diphosphate--fructose-6-phosphate 1-phosphotransferase [Bryobacterales bacterium]